MKASTQSGPSAPSLSDTLGCALDPSACVGHGAVTLPIIECGLEEMNDSLSVE